MRIAIISDIHGNLEALKTTLADIQKRKIDQIFCLGDIVEKGHHPEECVKLVRENCEVVVQGNCDVDMDTSIYQKPLHHVPVELMHARVNWLNRMLSEESKEYLLNLPFCYEFYMSGSLIRLFHASPLKKTNVIINEDSYEDKYKMFEPSENTVSKEVADVVIYGHLHCPYMNKFYNKTLINVGSVGNSFNVVRDKQKDSNVLETTASHYLILEGEYGAKEYGADFSFEFVRVHYDIDKELEDLEQNLEPEAYEKELRQGVYRNMSKIADKARELEKKGKI